MYKFSSTLTSLEPMRASGLGTKAFSSSCATGEVQENLPISEATPQSPVSPYGRIKLMGEQIRADMDHLRGLRSVACIISTQSAGKCN